MADDLLAGQYGQGLTGIAGAITGLVLFRKNTLFESISSVIAGAGCAIFVAPAVTEYFNIISPKMDRAVTYFAGVFGLLILNGLFVIVRKWQEDPWALLDKIRGLRSGGDAGTGGTK